jgi:NhaA family Na+:H+ antiporter
VDSNPAGDRASFSIETLGFGLILTGVIVGVTWSWLSWTTFHHLSATPWRVGLLSTLHLGSFHDLVVNGLLSSFFFSVGLELARERRDGVLRDLRSALTPLVAALGGMATCAVLSVVWGLASHTPVLVHAWGVPMATDVALVVSVLALATKNSKPALRLFLLTLAVADDVGSVLVLLFTGSLHLHPVALAGAFVVLGASPFVMRRYSTRTNAAVIALLLWTLFSVAGLDPYLSGVFAGYVVSRADRSGGIERRTGIFAYVVALPLFCLVACGLHVSELSMHGTVGTVLIGTFFIRLIGKTVGVFGGAQVAIRTLRPSTSILQRRELLGGAILCVIGFDVPLLFAQTLVGAGTALYSAFDAGLLLSSVVAAVAGVLLIRSER